MQAERCAGCIACVRVRKNEWNGTVQRAMGERGEDASCGESERERQKEGDGEGRLNDGCRREGDNRGVGPGG